jgi:hypothetical protein
MTETIFAAVFYGFMGLGAFFTVAFLTMMCIDEFGGGNK